MATSSTELPLTRNPKSSINETEDIFGDVAVTASNNPLIYIRNRIGDTGEPYEIPVSTSLSRFLCSSKTILTLLSVKNDWVQPIKSLSIPNYLICCPNFNLET